MLSALSALGLQPALQPDSLLESSNRSSAASADPPVVPPSGQWTFHPGDLNCYDGHGAPGASGSPHAVSITVDECKRTCLAASGCQAVVVKFESEPEAPTPSELVRCFLREEVRPNDCVLGSTDFELYTFQKAPDGDGDDDGDSDADPDADAAPPAAAHEIVLTPGEKNAWARMKAVIEMDYICVGFRDADEGTKYEGMVGSVLGTLSDKEVYVTCGGLTEVQRKMFTRAPERYIGRVFTAKGNNWYPSGAIRHPQFQRWRNDKAPEDCTYEQIPEGVRCLS
mgnify:CR=1 FL=1